jgi:ribosomal RNA assembly protein
MTKTKISVHGNTIAIIGKWDNLLLAKKAVEMILEGKMHSTVKRFLEENVIE